MQEDKNSLIRELNEKISTLIHRFEDVKNEMVILKDENSELKKQLEERESLINDLETKTNNIKFANTLLASFDDKDEVKKKISKIVREIDKCIALMNR